MKKIILLTGGYPFCKKGEEFIESEMRFLDYRNYDVQICAVTPQLPDIINQFIPQNVKAMILFPCKFSIFDKIKFGMRAIWNVQFWQEFFDLIKQGKFKAIRTLFAFCARGERIYHELRKYVIKSDQVILYSYWLVDSAYAIAMLKQKYGYKAISRVHGGDLYEERNKDGYLPMRKYLFDTLDAVFSVSDKGRRYLNKRYGYYDKIHTSYLGTINHRILHECKERDYFHIVSCSYLVPLKRVPMIAEALNNISNKKIVWTHFGDGVEREILFENTSHFPDNVIFDFKGNTLHEDIMKFYENTDIDCFINVSTTEGLPISIMEAISFGIPVIATDVGGTSEIVIDNYNGFLMPQEITSIDLKKKIIEVMSLPKDKLIKYRMNSYECWNRDFNAFNNYEDFYDNLR